MKFKHLQLNTESLGSPTAIMKYIINNGIDIATVQELSYTIGIENPLKMLATEAGYNFIEGINYYYKPKNLVDSVAIITRWDIRDSLTLMFNGESYLPKELDDFNGFSKENKLVNDHGSTDYDRSRGIKHSVKSRSILSALIETPDSHIRVVTTHFPVSDFCSETHQMFEMAQMMSSLIKQSMDTPTLLAGDFNIQADSYTIDKISENLICHTRDIKNTLAPDHIAITNGDLPDGVGIDHIFSKKLKLKTLQLLDVDFSDHKALITEFEG